MVEQEKRKNALNFDAMGPSLARDNDMDRFFCISVRFLDPFFHGKGGR